MQLNNINWEKSVEVLTNTHPVNKFINVLFFNLQWNIPYMKLIEMISMKWYNINDFFIYKHIW